MTPPVALLLIALPPAQQPLPAAGHDPSQAAAVSPPLARNYVDVRQHGAVGDGLVDDTLAIREAAAQALGDGLPLYFPAAGGMDASFLPDAGYRVTGTIDLRGVRKVVMDGPVVFSAASSMGPVLQVGGTVGDYLPYDLDLWVLGTSNPTDFSCIGVQANQLWAGSQLTLRAISRCGVGLELLAFDGEHRSTGVRCEVGDFYQVGTDFRVNRSGEGSGYYNEWTFFGGYWRTSTALGGANVHIQSGSFASSRWYGSVFEGAGPLVEGDTMSACVFDAVRVEKPLPVTLYEASDPGVPAWPIEAALAPPRMFTLRPLTYGSALTWRVNATEQAGAIAIDAGLALSGRYGGAGRRQRFGAPVVDDLDRLSWPGATLWDLDAQAPAPQPYVTYAGFEPFGDGGWKWSNGAAQRLGSLIFATRLQVSAGTPAAFRVNGMHRGCLYVQAWDHSGNVISDPDEVFGPFGRWRTTTGGSPYFIFSAGVGDVLLGPAVGSLVVGIGDDIYAQNAGTAQTLPEVEIVTGSLRFVDAGGAAGLPDAPRKGLVPDLAQFSDEVDPSRLYSAGVVRESHLASGGSAGGSSVVLDSTLGLEIGDTIVIDSDTFWNGASGIPRATYARITGFTITPNEVEISPTLVADSSAGNRVRSQSWSVLRRDHWRGSLTADPGSGLEGDMYFNTATRKVRVLAASVWREL